MDEIIYHIDMDGVLAIWEDVSEEETHERGHFRKKQLELSAAAFVRMMKNNGKDIRILSSTYVDDHSRQDKTWWLEHFGLGDIPRIFVPYGEDKYRFINECALPVLIDDYGKNLSAWENHGYLSIKFMNQKNKQPKFSIVNGTIHIKEDSWAGYSIDYRMSPKQMYNAVTSIAEAEVRAKAS